MFLYAYLNYLLHICFLMHSLNGLIPYRGKRLPPGTIDDLAKTLGKGNFVLNYWLYIHVCVYMYICIAIISVEEEIVQ